MNSLKKLWEEQREMMLERLKKSLNTDEYRANQREAQFRAWQRPERREATTKALIAYYSNPVHRQLASERQAVLWVDPEVRAVRREKMGEKRAKLTDGREACQAY